MPWHNLHVATSAAICKSATPLSTRTGRVPQTSRLCSISKLACSCCHPVPWHHTICHTTEVPYLTTRGAIFIFYYVIFSLTKSLLSLGVTNLLLQKLNVPILIFPFSVLLNQKNYSKTSGGNGPFKFLHQLTVTSIFHNLSSCLVNCLSRKKLHYKIEILNLESLGDFLACKATNI